MARGYGTADEAFDQVVDFLEHFSALEDPRQRAKVLYPLDEVLLLCLLGGPVRAPRRLRSRHLSRVHPGTDDNQCPIWAKSIGVTFGPSDRIQGIIQGHRRER